VRTKLYSKKDNVNMAYATHSDGAKIPPPYGFYNETNSGVSYQQVPPPVYSPNLGKLRKFN
jgi:hypothetical protein